MLMRIQLLQENLVYINTFKNGRKQFLNTYKFHNAKMNELSHCWVWMLFGLIFTAAGLQQQCFVLFFPPWVDFFLSYFLFIFEYILLIMLFQLSDFPPLPSSTQYSHFLQQSPPPQFMPMCHSYTFFGYSITYTVLNVPLSILYLPICT